MATATNRGSALHHLSIELLNGGSWELGHGDEVLLGGKRIPLEHVSVALQHPNAALTIWTRVRREQDHDEGDEWKATSEPWRRARVVVYARGVASVVEFPAGGLDDD